jgi:hypothetical protein
MKAYPTDERGQLDAGAHVDTTKPCCARIDHTNVSRFESPTTWCSLPSNHTGQHSGPLPAVLGTNTYDKGKRRG